MSSLVDDFQLSRDGTTHARRRLAASRMRDVNSLTELKFDEYSTYWRDMLRAISSNGGQGQGETIAIIDSGFSPDLCGDCGVDETKCLDLTGEGLHDGCIHGTLISALTHLIAPEAVQYHVKLHNAKGTIPGKTYVDRFALIGRAFEHVERVGATVVNVSWNHLTRLGFHNGADVRPRFFCSCPICEIFTGYIERSDVNVFVSEGNYLFDWNNPDAGRPQGSWSCPAAAILAIPVVAYQEGRTTYNTNLDTTCGVPAPVRVEVPARGGAFKSFWWRLFPSERSILTGSSFSTPLVAATYSALRSAFLPRGFNQIMLPRSKDMDDNKSSTPYTFPLELVFVPPSSHGPAGQSYETNWAGLYFNVFAAANRLLSDGESDKAVELCRLLADMMSVAYARMEKHDFAPYVGAMAAELYLTAVTILHQTELAITAPDYIAKAGATLAAMKERGHPAPPLEERLQQLEAFHQANVIEFMFRFSGPL
jgi:hypothetical protein